MTPNSRVARSDMQESWRAARRLPSFYALAISNLLPLVGLAFLGWRADRLILFYVLECVVVYFVTAKMLAFVAEQRELRIVRRFIVAGGLGLFMIGVFWAFAFHLGALWPSREPQPDLASALASRDFLLSVAYVAASHVYSYFYDFIGRKEHERLPVKAIEARWGGMFLGVLIVMLISPVLFLFRSPAVLAGVLVVVKALVALSAFVEERARAEGSEATSIAYTRPKATCPRCGRILRTDQAKQCFHCGADWHKGNAA